MLPLQVLHVAMHQVACHVAVSTQHTSRHDMSLSGHLKLPPAVNSCLRLQVQSVSEDELLDATPAAGHVATVPADICVVDTVEEARRVVNLLRNTYRNGDWFFACDTEVRLGQHWPTLLNITPVIQCVVA